jgi:membrane-associated protein
VIYWAKYNRENGLLDGLTFFDLLLHVDKFLDVIISRYGVYVYILIFLVIFCENGIFFPLPGDSLIFAGAAYAVAGMMNLWLLMIICFVSAVIGIVVNYYLGVVVGKQIYTRTKGRFIKREYVDKAQAFYEKHGGKAIIFSRFIPFIRQFTPFVAGIGRMSFKRMMFFNVVGVTAWVLVCSLAGYYFGNIPFVKENFTSVILGIIFVSLLPVIIGALGSKFKKNKPESGQE